MTSTSQSRRAREAAARDTRRAAQDLIDYLKDAEVWSVWRGGRVGGCALSPKDEAAIHAWMQSAFHRGRVYGRRLERRRRGGA